MLMASFFVFFLLKKKKFKIQLLFSNDFFTPRDSDSTIYIKASKKQTNLNFAISNFKKNSCSIINFVEPYKVKKEKKPEVSEKQGVSSFFLVWEENKFRLVVRNQKQSFVTHNI